MGRPRAHGEAPRRNGHAVLCAVLAGMLTRPLLPVVRMCTLGRDAKRVSSQCVHYQQAWLDVTACALQDVSKIENVLAEERHRYAYHAT
jgi:hypothetical protein